MCVADSVEMDRRVFSPAIRTNRHTFRKKPFLEYDFPKSQNRFFLLIYFFYIIVAYSLCEKMLRDYI